MELFLNGQQLVGRAIVEEWQAVEFACLPEAGRTLELWLDGEQLAPFLRPGDAQWYWAWNAQQAIGRHTLQLRLLAGANLLAEQHYSVEVQSRKLDRDQVQTLLDDIEELGRMLCYRLAAAGRLGVTGQAGLPLALERLLLLSSARLDELETAVLQLSRRPPQHITTQRRPVRAGAVRDLARLDPATLRGQPADDPDGLVEQQRIVDYNSPMQRVLRRLLDEMWRELQAGRRAAASGQLRQLAPQLERVVPRIAALRALPMLAELPPSRGGPVQLPRRWPDLPEYRCLARFWRDWRRQPSLRLDHGGAGLPIQELPRLYEYWCVLQLAHSLLELPGAQLREQCLLQSAGPAQGWTLQINQAGPLLTLELGARRWCLYYQRAFQPHGSGPFVSLDRHVRVPDLALEISAEQGLPTLVLADAKYRLDASGGVPAAALAEAYSYRGGIGPPGGPAAVAAVWLLYPGRGPAERYASGIASLPLLPGHADSLAAALRSWIH